MTSHRRTLKCGLSAALYAECDATRRFLAGYILSVSDSDRVVDQKLFCRFIERGTRPLQDSSSENNKTRMKNHQLLIAKIFSKLVSGS